MFIVCWSCLKTLTRLSLEGPQACKIPINIHTYWSEIHQYIYVDYYPSFSDDDQYININKIPINIKKIINTYMLIVIRLFRMTTKIYILIKFRSIYMYWLKSINIYILIKSQKNLGRNWSIYICTYWSDFYQYILYWSSSDFLEAENVSGQIDKAWQTIDK